MALYLIAFEDEENTSFYEIEAKNIKDAAKQVKDVGDGFTARVWRVAGPPKTVTLTVETAVSVEIS